MKLSATAFRIFFGFAGVTAASVPGGSRLPFELREHHLVIVRGAIGSIEGLRFLIDTGSNPTMVDRKILKTLGLQVQPSYTITFGQKSRTETAVVSSIRLGPVSAEMVRVSVGNLFFLNGVDAIIGLDLLSRCSFSIDYEQRQVVFGPIARPEAGVGLDITPPFLTVPISISGRRYRLLVDTGSYRVVLFRSRAQDRLPPLSAHGALGLNHLSGTYRLVRVLLRSVEFGTATIDRLEGFISDAPVDNYPAEIDGVLGIHALASKYVEFDFQRGRLGFH
jgi:predicted aspartyl protease